MTALSLIEELARFVAENGDAEVRFAKSCNVGEPYWHIEAVECSLEISENDSDAEDVCTLLPRKATLFCPKCGADYRGKAFAARIIRKNREARLKHKIKKEIWKHERDEAKHNEFIRFINDSARLLHDLAPMSGAYGQDVEGS